MVVKFRNYVYKYQVAPEYYSQFALSVKHPFEPVFEESNAIGEVIHTLSTQEFDCFCWYYTKFRFR